MIKKLEWDSNFFSKYIGKFNVSGNFEAREFYEFAKKFDLVYVFSQEPVDVNAKLMDIKLTFSKQIKNNTPTKPNIQFFDYNVHSYKKLLELVYLSGHESRFLKDDFFSEKDFKKMYKVWIDKNIKNDHVLVFLYNNSIKGFVSYSGNEKCSSIDLIAVDPKMQGRGIGHTLISAVEHNLTENTVLRVPTQQTNKGACKFYRTHGFKLLTKQYIYHYEPNSI